MASMIKACSYQKVLIGIAEVVKLGGCYVNKLSLTFSTVFPVSSQEYKI